MRSRSCLLSGRLAHSLHEQINEADYVGCRMGELEPWIDENFVRTVWYNMGEQVNVKMIRDKFSG